MKVLTSPAAARQAVDALSDRGVTTGLVPTMGAIHRGHLSLVQAARQENEVVMASIFVNPIQFNNPDDLARYPRTLEADLEKLKAAGCDLVFVPEARDMYPQQPLTQFAFGPLDEVMEGAYRPGHFSGVALVVLKLFHILRPQKAYFGQKDLQQFKIIERLVKDTSLPVTLRMLPIVREPSGLALSSRNQRLSGEGKQVAGRIFQALQKAALELTTSRNITRSVAAAQQHLAASPGIEVEYLTWVNTDDLQPVERISNHDQLALCFAGYVEGVRLIDNIIVDIHADRSS